MRFRNFRVSMLQIGLLLVLVMISARCRAQTAPGSMDVHWYEGTTNCAANTHPALQVLKYNERTYILRENICDTFEAPFIYLLMGSDKALLIDTGDVADANKMPLARTVLQLLPDRGPQKMPLIVVHTHRHLDHRAGDGQFAQLPNVEMAGFDIDSVRRFYHFTDWPNGVAEIDLGGRTVDAIPTPGHNETEVSFYDRYTGLFFSGDFLIPGRLLVDDTGAYIASAKRVAAFVKDRPVTYVLGGHVEKDAAGELFPWESTFHPNEHVLQMTKDDLLALPAALENFNGFYSVSGKFVMMNSIRMLIVFSVLIVVALIAIVWLLVRYLRRRRRARKLKAAKTDELIQGA